MKHRTKEKQEQQYAEIERCIKRHEKKKRAKRAHRCKMKKGREQKRKRE